MSRPPGVPGVPCPPGSEPQHTQESKAALAAHHHHHRTLADDPTGLGFDLTRKSNEFLSAQLAIAQKRPVKCDEARELHVVGWS